ncbi:MAG: phosphoglycolate phosphatase [Campylobacterota bacterium]|nr:phosphoglycolate phosphatase [Campylobacterota bacterium]
MLLKNKKAILFDLDGTLIDSVPDLANSVNFTLKKINYKQYSENTIRFWVGNGASTLIRRALLGKNNVDDFIEDNFFKEALDIFLDHYSHNLSNNTKLYPNVKETLKNLKLQNFKMAIITNKPYSFIEPILTNLDIKEYFDDFIGADSLTTKKPSSEPLLYMCKKLNIKIEDAVMVGDSKNDIIAAKNANIDSIAVGYGYNYDEDIDIYNPTYKIDDFKNIIKVLNV